MLEFAMVKGCYDINENLLVFFISVFSFCVSQLQEDPSEKLKYFEIL